MTDNTASSLVFRHGVASGDPLTDRVIVWTRVTPTDELPVNVEWELSLQPDFEDVIAANSVRTSGAIDFTAKVDITGLEPNTSYYYRFRALGEASAIGRTKTLPAGSVEHVRFAQVCCAKLNVGFFNAYSRIADRIDLDFVLHLGDYIYESAQEASGARVLGVDAKRTYIPPGECKTLDDYRQRYAQYRLDRDLQRLHQTLPIIATVDDHEIADGAWREGSEDHNSERDGLWSERRSAALRARWEWMPLRLPNPDDDEQIFQSVSVGNLLDLIVLDTRTRRDAPLDDATIPDAQRTALSPQQCEWLFRQLASSQGTWRVVASPTLMTDMRIDPLPSSCREALQKLKIINPHNGGPDSDPWAGYQYERDAILQHIQKSQIGNVVVLSGDVHVSLAAELHSGDADKINVAVEFVAPSVTSQNLDDKMGWAPRTDSLPIEQALVASVPRLRWCELDSHGYVVVDVNRDRILGEWWFVDDIRNDCDGETRGATWQVESGRAELRAPTM